MCGEKERRKRNVICLRGSPPRVRGKGSSSFDLLARHRITPACAGKSHQIQLCAIGIEDHPRVCGEKRLRITKRWKALGSPPRVRGKVLHHIHRFGALRITPACAGKSSSNKYRFFRFEDHPRVCGEKFPAFRSWTKKAGSPPRVRGKALSFCLLRQIIRITPACAGKR